MNYWDYPRIFQPIHSLDDDPHFLTFCGFNHHVLSQQKSMVVLSLSLPISLFVQPPLFRWNGGETGSTQAPAALALAALAAAHCMACIAGSHCRVLCSARLALEALELEDLAWQRWPPWMFLLGKRCDTLNRMDKWMDVIVTEYFFKKNGQGHTECKWFCWDNLQEFGACLPNKKRVFPTPIRGYFLPVFWFTPGQPRVDMKKKSHGFWGKWSKKWWMWMCVTSDGRWMDRLWYDTVLYIIQQVYSLWKHILDAGHCRTAWGEVMLGPLISQPNTIIALIPGFSVIASHSSYSPLDRQVNQVINQLRHRFH